MIVFKRTSNITPEQIRLGLNSFILVCRETKSDFLQIDTQPKNNEEEKFDKFEKVNKALRLSSMVISEQLLKRWFEHVQNSLECMTPERRHFEIEYNQMSPSSVYLLPHEFLFLFSNCQSRLNVMSSVYRPNFASKKSVVYQWEISGAKSTKGFKAESRHLNLLNEDAFEDKAPQKLIQKNLNSQIEQKRIVSVGKRLKNAPCDQTKGIGDHAIKQLLFDPNSGINKNKEHQKEFERKRSKRMIEYNRATNNLSLEYSDSK